MEATSTEGTERRAYVAPTLVVYGPVADLTASGTGTSAENMHPPGQRKRYKP